jgi:hypothetical protein
MYVIKYENNQNLSKVLVSLYPSFQVLISLFPSFQALISLFPSFQVLVSLFLSFQVLITDQSILFFEDHVTSLQSPGQTVAIYTTRR